MKEVLRNSFNKVFRKKTAGAIDKSLNDFLMLKEVSPHQGGYFHTSDNKKIPSEYHRINIIIQNRNLPFTETEVIKGRMHYKISEHLDYGPNGEVYTTLGRLLLAYCDANFYFDHEGTDNRLRAKFEKILAKKLDTWAGEHSFDLNRKLDISFLRNTLYKIVLVASEMRGEAFIKDGFSKSVLKLMATEHVDRNTSSPIPQKEAGRSHLRLIHSQD